MNDVAKSVRAAISGLQNAVLALPQATLETQHYFADGMYLRWLFRPAGTLIIGKVHKKEHFYLCISGSVSITDGDSPAAVLKAPGIIVSKPGTKRAVYAIEDSVCITVHRTTETDMEAIERDLVEPAPESKYLPGNVLKPEQVECASS